jgi:hypothetical protein
VGRGDETITTGGRVAMQATMQAAVIAHEIQNSGRTMAAPRGTAQYPIYGRGGRGPTSHRHHGAGAGTGGLGWVRPDPSVGTQVGQSCAGRARRAGEMQRGNLRSVTRREWETMNHDVRLVVHMDAGRVG